MIPTKCRLLATGDLADRVGVSRKRIREWVRRRRLTPAATDRHGYYLWSESDVTVAARVRDEYRARLDRLAASVCQKELLAV